MEDVKKDEVQNDTAFTAEELGEDEMIKRVVDYCTKSKGYIMPLVLLNNNDQVEVKACAKGIHKEMCEMYVKIILDVLAGISHNMMQAMEAKKAAENMPDIEDNSVPQEAEEIVYAEEEDGAKK